MARKVPKIPLPVDGSRHVKNGIVHAIALAQIALTAARARASKKRSIVARLRTKLEERDRKISLLEEELRLKDLRMGRVKPRRRPHYRGVERLVILELKAASGWSKAEAAARLLLRPATIAGWTKRLDEKGEDTLVQTPEPINRFPHFVRHIVCRLKVLCPTMGNTPKPPDHDPGYLQQDDYEARHCKKVGRIADRTGTIRPNELFGRDSPRSQRRKPCGHGL